MGAMEEMSRKGEGTHIVSSVLVDVAASESDHSAWSTDGHTTTLQNTEEVLPEVANGGDGGNVSE